MSSGKRKLSFLGFAPPGAEELKLDEEMERAVWGAGAGAAGPHRDSAAPPPGSEQSPPVRDPAAADGSGDQSEGRGEARHEEDEERRVQRNLRHLPGSRARKFSLQENAGANGGQGHGGHAGHGGEPPQRRVSVSPGQAPLPEGQEAHHTPSHIRGSTVQIGRKEGGHKLHKVLSDSSYKMYDHNPHAGFVQLAELHTGSGEEEAGTGASAGAWQQSARWIKYEQTVEGGGARWGRARVASLSFHSLLQLHRCLETGVVLLDLQERDLPGVAYRVAEKLAADGLIAEDEQPALLRTLMLRHKHVRDSGFRFSLSGRGKHSSYTSLQSLPLGGRRRSSVATAAAAERLASRHPSVVGSELEYVPGAEDGAHHNDALMRRIPEGAEATVVLVGAVGFLDQPACAFVRLADAVHMPAVTEVPLPVRFVCVLLGPGPPAADPAPLDYHEVGRSISTLMANPAFHSVAYQAEDRRDILSAINEFMDDSIVLPPGDWDRRALLSLDELRARSDKIRRRREEVVRRRSLAAAAATPLLDEKKALLLAESGMPPEEPDDPLSRSGRLFGGVIRDMKRRYPHYISDFTEALNGQVAAATIFMYFAALSSAITFGGLLAEKTHGQIGISETLVFTCAGGVIFALASGQPLMITGATGPLLLLDDALSGFCTSYGFDFLAARMYAGLWMIVIALCVASVEGSVAVKKITRFTEDIFAFLISLIFISEPITNIINVYRAHPLSQEPSFYCAHDAAANLTLGNVTVGNLTDVVPPPAPALTPQPNTALWCTMLTLTTFIIAYYLRIFRNGKFLGRSARRALGDFGVPIAIALMVGAAAAMPVWTETLRVPPGLSPTDTSRPWLVPFAGKLGTIPPWAAAAMALPALMVYIIVFMETHIAELIVDKPERNLRKGSGFHMDIVIMSLINAVCGLFGAPWQCVATVRSVSHVSALTVMSTTHAPGDKPFIVEVKEQRVSGLLVAIMVGLSVLAAGALQQVPMSVLFGVFLYMGISALGGIEFWDRVILMFKPVKYHPPTTYVRRVPTSKMHLFTLVQLGVIVVLYVVKSSKFSLALPFFLVMCVPLRMGLSSVFTPMQLRALDGVQKDKDKDDEPDFYEEAPLP